MLPALLWTANPVGGTFLHFAKELLVQQQVCRFTVPRALFEESMPPAQKSWGYSQLQEKHRWQSEILLYSKWRPFFKMAATR